MTILGVLLLLTIVGLGDGVGGGRQLVELAGVVGVPDVGGVLVDAGAALVDRNHAADAEPEKFAVMRLYYLRPERGAVM